MRYGVAVAIGTALALGAGAGAAGAQEAGRRVLRVRPAPEAVVMDGRLDEAAWAAADVARGFVQQEPREGEPATQPTEVRVLHADDALYVGARLTDSSPDSVEARVARRDQAVQGDWFYVYLDSYHDRRTAFAFGVNAAGVQRDLRVSDETSEDAGWDAVWASRVVRDAGGWSAELRIPLSQLRFDGGGDDPAWGVNFERFVGRRNERSFWSPRPRDSDRFVSLFGRLEGVGALEPSRGVELVPYSAARVTRAPVAAGDPFRGPTEATGSVGADLRMGLGHGLTLSATLNPDFGQVEADPATVNLTAFEVFQQERRPFFVEGGDIFELAMPVWPPFFYSRRIGRSPQGSAPGSAAWVDAPEASTILGALKVSGKTEGGWSLGLLEAVTSREEVRWIEDDGTPGRRSVEPLTNHAAARVVRELGEGRTGLGLLAVGTHRRIDESSLAHLHDAAYGLAFDGWHRFAGDAWELRWGLLGSHVRGDTLALLRTQRAPGHYFQRPDAGHTAVDSTRTSLSGASANVRLMKRAGRWRTGLFAEAASPGYEVSDFGFNPTLDHAQANAWLGYEDYTPGRLFRSWSVRGAGMVQSTTDGLRKELTADLGFDFTLPSYWGGGVWVMRHQAAWDPFALRGGPALRKPGHWMGNVGARSDGRRTVSGDAWVFWDVEDEGGGRTLNVEGTVRVRASDRLRLEVGAGVSTGRDPAQWVTRADADGEAVAVLGTLERTTVSLPVRADYAFSPDLTLQLYARPFVSAGRYGAFKEVADPRAPRFGDRFLAWGPDAVERGEEVRVDRDGDGAPDLHFADPDFNARSLQVNAVLRWQWRPGSTLYAVWTHDRSGRGVEAFRLGRDLDRLLDAPGRHVFLVKASYWLGL